MNRKIKIAVVDGHELMRRGIRQSLSELSDFEFVGEGENSEDALQLAIDEQPDILLLDMNMQGDCIALIKLLQNLVPRPKAIMLTVDEDLNNLRDCMTSGAHGYVLKGVGARELVSIIQTVYAGGKYVSPDLAARLLADPSNDTAVKLTNRISDLTTLTQREKQILELIGKGESNANISKVLQLSEATVKHYITPMFRKLGVRNRTEAALKATSLVF
jgi:two-component system, NarL family, nitrate/nitrite response regulator NarL